MIPPEVRERLDEAGIVFCLIGAHALAIEERFDLLDDWGRRAWARVVRDLDATS